MKIGIIVRRLNTKGGVQRHVLSLAQELKKMGHKVVVYTFVLDKEKCFEELLYGLEIVPLHSTSHSRKKFSIPYVGYFINLLQEVKAAKELARHIEKDVDVLNPHDHICYKVAYFFKRNIKNVPSVWTMHDMPTKKFSYFRESRMNPNLRLGVLKRFFYWLVDQYDIWKYIRVQDKVVVLDTRDKEWVRQYFKKNAEIVRNGLDIEKFENKVRSGISGKICKVLMVGIFLSHRRFEDGIQAIKILQDKGYDVRATIVGDHKTDIEYYEKIKTLLGELGLEKQVTITGKISEEELLRQYQENDIFLFPNHLQSWGLVVFEAMASGLPVIISKSAGASEVLKDGENALIISPKSPGKLATQMERLINDKTLYKKLSADGRSFAAENFDWKKLTGHMFSIFKQYVRS